MFGHNTCRIDGATKLCKTLIIISIILKTTSNYSKVTFK